MQLHVDTWILSSFLSITVCTFTPSGRNMTRLNLGEASYLCHAELRYSTANTCRERLYLCCVAQIVRHLCLRNLTILVSGKSPLSITGFTYAEATKGLTRRSFRQEQRNSLCHRADCCQHTPFAASDFLRSAKSMLARSCQRFLAHRTSFVSPWDESPSSTGIWPPTYRSAHGIAPVAHDDPCGSPH